MSPVGVRRYRAERLLRKEFEALRASVLAAVQRRLGAGASAMDVCDLEACYAQAWQGLYAAILEGEQIASPTGWLIVVTHRRAIDEQRARMRVSRVGQQRGEGECDYAHELHERERLRQLLEGLRTRLSAREREAAVLCYLQGLSRAQAAARMGVSERAMRKLLEGRGAGRPGASSKLGALVETISEGRWCEQQSSLMRALAFGILDPGGERYQLALLHSSQCSACRAYVASLRGLAAALPPVALPVSLGAAVLARALEVGHASASGAAKGGTGAGAAGAGAAGPGAGSGAGTVGGAAGAGAGIGGGAAGVGVGAAGLGGASGGGWLLAGGSLGAKLVAGCVLALTIGAGCIALGTHAPRSARESPRRARAARTASATNALRASLAGEGALGSGGPPQAVAASGAAAARSATLSPAAKASLEFGPEQPASGARSVASDLVSPASTARSRRARAASASGRDGSDGSAQVSESEAPAVAQGGSQAAEAMAEREFAPG